MNHQTFIQALELTILMVVIIAFITTRRMSVPVQTSLATVSWNG
jgi:hypothetical protein